MADMTDYLKNALRDAVLRNTAYTSPTTVYAALFTTATTDAGGGTEVTGGSYARQAITWTTGSAGACDNTAAVSFTGMPAATVTHFAIFDALTSGNMLLHDALTSSKTVASGETAQFAAGALDVAFT